jgi:hypothetical protein
MSEDSINSGTALTPVAMTPPPRQARGWYFFGIEVHYVVDQEMRFITLVEGMKKKNFTVQTRRQARNSLCCRR